MRSGRSPARRDLLVGFALFAVAGGLVWLARSRPEPGQPPAAAPPPSAGPDAGPPCPPYSLPDHGVCIPVPHESEPPPPRIELLPNRPAEYSDYVLPLEPRFAGASPTGAGVFVPAPPGRAVALVSLEAQLGNARVLRSEPGSAVLLTLHRVARGQATRWYVLAHDGIEPSALEGGLPAGTILGRVAARETATGLHLTVRQLRGGVSPDELTPRRLLDDARSVLSDPRNVLPLRAHTPRQ